MKKDILDKLELKNFENLSEQNFDNSTTLGINKSLDKLKISDDVSNEDIIKDEYTSSITNSYVDLNEAIENRDNSSIKNKNNVYSHPLIPNQQ